MQVEKLTGDLINMVHDQMVLFKENRHCTIRPYNQVMLESYVKYHDSIQNLEVYEDDVWITTPPKSGTRWMQELVWCVKNGTDIKKAKSIPVDERVPFLEIEALEFNSFKSIDYVKNMKSPRIIKSHLVYDLLPKQISEKKPKIIHLYRNPRDACLSYFHHFKIYFGYNGDLETFVSCFLEDSLLLSSFPAITFSYWKKMETYDNMLFVSYEEMSVDLPSVIKKVAAFLDVKIPEEDIPKLCDHLSFDKMRKNPMVNLEEMTQKFQASHNFSHPGGMINKGKVGRWKEYLTKEMVERFKRYEEEWLKNSNLKYTFEI